MEIELRDRAKDGRASEPDGSQPRFKFRELLTGSRAMGTGVGKGKSTDRRTLSSVMGVVRATMCQGIVKKASRGAELEDRSRAKSALGLGAMFKVAMNQAAELEVSRPRQRRLAELQEELFLLLRKREGQCQVCLQHEVL